MLFASRAALSLRGPVKILIEPVGVISTSWTSKPAASTPAIARRMSSGVKRDAVGRLDLRGLRGGIETEICSRRPKAVCLTTMALSMAFNACGFPPLAPLPFLEGVPNCGTSGRTFLVCRLSRRHAAEGYFVPNSGQTTCSPSRLNTGRKSGPTLPQTVKMSGSHIGPEIMLQGFRPTYVE